MIFFNNPKLGLGQTLLGCSHSKAFSNFTAVHPNSFHKPPLKHDLRQVSI